MLYIGDKVSVTCTDTGKTSQGEIVRGGKDMLAVTLVEARGTLLTFKRTKPKLWVANLHGLEFTIKE
jgi:hypothetical protein